MGGCWAFLSPHIERLSCRILHTSQVESRHIQFEWSQLGNSQVYSVLKICRNLEQKMEWATPTFEEISLSCEINSYVNAEL
jgi:coenzyme PQQ precursor peptide PqqA